MQALRQPFLLLATERHADQLTRWTAMPPRELPLRLELTGTHEGLAYARYRSPLPTDQNEEHARLALLRQLLPHLRHSPLALYLPRAEAKTPTRWAFDLDGTLLPDELLPRLAERYGRAEEMARLTEEAMQGRTPFAQSFAERTALLEGLPVSCLQTFAQELTLPAGNLYLVERLQNEGLPLALVSGNYLPFVQGLAERLAIPTALGSAIRTDAAGRLLGLASEGLVDEGRKRDFLARWGDPLATAYVGDGANDLPALALAGHAFLVGECFVRSHGLSLLTDLPPTHTPD